jgi:DNA topoisomerase I
MHFVVLVKAKKKPVGSLSPSGKYRKVAENKWRQVADDHTKPEVRSTFPKHIQGLAIPPAWTNVQINLNPKARLYATGYDVKGRKQSLYSPEHKAAQSASKFERIDDLEKKFDSLIVENSDNLSKGVEEAYVLALVIATGLRPGTLKDTKAEKQAYGATTLEGRHVVGTKASEVKLEFVGKKGVDISVGVPEYVGRILLQRKRKAGDTGKLFKTTPGRLLRYTRRLAGGAGYRPKDLRTYRGTQLAIEAIRRVKTPPTNLKEYKKAVREVAKQVAPRLGHTPTVSLQSYINPKVFASWKKGAGV